MTISHGTNEYTSTIDFQLSLAVVVLSVRYYPRFACTISFLTGQHVSGMASPHE